MENVLSQLTQMLKLLSFSDENSDILANKLFIAILENVYQTMLPEDKLNELKIYVEQNDTEKIKSIASGLDSQLFISNFQKSTQLVVSDFIKDIIDSCPEDLLDDLKQKVDLVQTWFNGKIN